MTSGSRFSIVRFRRKVLAVVWGDLTGLLIFLGSLCLFGLVWRTAFLINDSYTLANGLYALEQGSLEMTTAAYGPTIQSPGTTVYGGRAYARNYGVLFASLPVLAVVRGVTAVADLRIVLVAVWSLLALATVLLAGRLTQHQRLARVGGSAVVLCLFVGNVVLATPLDPAQPHLLALQIVHMLVAAFVGVFTYRLVAEVHDRRRGYLASVLVLLSTPLAFWSAVPKRHVLTGAVVIAVAFAIARSRDGDRPYSTLVRASAYALAGLLAWVHAPEALVLVVALVAVDVPTAPANDRRTLAVVGGVFFMSLLPMLATNSAITGDPLKVPRALRTATAGAEVSVAEGAGAGGSGGDSTAGEDSKEVLTSVFVAISLLESAIRPVSTLIDLLADGVAAVFTGPDEVFDAFVRGGYVSRVAQSANDAPAANLSLLESAPVLAGLAAFVPLLWKRIRYNPPPVSILRKMTAADAFVVLLALGYSLVYAARLPIHAQVTVRYLFPLYPLGIYGLVRLPGFGGVLTDHWRTFVWTYTGAVLIGGQLVLVVLVSLAPGRGEAFQFHALLALGTASLVGFWSILGRTDVSWGRVGAASIALATAAATTFVLFVSLEYYALGDAHALPMMRALGELVKIL